MGKYIKVGAASAGVIAAAFVLLVIFGPLGAGAGHTQRTKLEVRLDATSVDPLASGKLKWEERLNSDDSVERQRTSTEVEDITGTGAYEVRVTRDAGATVVSAGEMFVNIDALGFGDLNLDTRDGDAVPVMQTGDLVEVFDPSGDLVLSGVLQEK